MSRRRFTPRAECRSSLAARLAAVGILLALAAIAARAQTLRLKVVDADGFTPMAGRIVEARLLGEAREPARTRSGADGSAVLRLPEVGRYRVTMLRIGFLPVHLGDFDVSLAPSALMVVPVSEVRVTLDTVRIIAANRCVTVGILDSSVLAAVQQARTLIASALIRSPIHAKWSSYRLVTDPDGLPLSPLLVERFESSLHELFRVRDVHEWDDDGFIRESQSMLIYRAPDAAVLLSEQFLERHCFRGERSVTAPERIGIRFDPIESRRDRSGIAGVMWLDALSAELLSVDFSYDSKRAVPGFGGSGSVEFGRMPSGEAFVVRWYLRIPRITEFRVDTDRSRAPPSPRAVVNAYTVVAAGIDSIYTNSGTVVRFHDGMEAALAKVRLESGRTPRCEAAPGTPAGDSLAVFGVILDSDGRLVGGQSVRGSWTSVGSSRFARSVREHREVEATDGFFLLCGLPRTTVRIEVVARGGRFSPVSVRLGSGAMDAPVTFRPRAP